MTRFVNNLKTTLLLAAIMGLAVGIGSIWGANGLVVGFLLGGLMNVVAFFFSDRIALATVRAHEVSPAETPALHRMVEELSDRAGIPKPRVYVSPAEAPNAFATGRSPRHAAVCVTEGLVRVLTPQQIRAVLAHEIAHVKHHDMLISTIAATVAGAISVLAHLAIFMPVSRGGDDEGPNPLVVLLTAIFAPLAAMLIQLAISRSREYAADHRGAELHGNPVDLAQALLALESRSRAIPLRVPETQSNMFIVQPLTGESLSSLFSTHPPVAKRVEKLYEQASVRVQ